MICNKYKMKLKELEKENVLFLARVEQLTAKNKILKKQLNKLESIVTTLEAQFWFNYVTK